MAGRMALRLLCMGGFTVAINFAWEMAQGGFFKGMSSLPFWAASRLCLRAAFGDLAITVFAFGVAALVARDTAWGGSRRPVVPFLTYLAVGLAVTIALEKHAVATGRWAYGARMPQKMGIGLLPIAQWIVVPALVFSVIQRASTRDQAETGS